MATVDPYPRKSYRMSVVQAVIALLALIVSAYHLPAVSSAPPRDDRAGTSPGTPTAEPVGPAPEVPRKVLPSTCHLTHERSIKVIDLRDGESRAEIADALAHALNLGALRAVPWPFPPTDVDPVAAQDATRLGTSGLPEVLLLGRLRATDHSVFPFGGGEEYRIDGVLDVVLISGPCHHRHINTLSVEASGSGWPYREALSSLAQELAAAVKRVVNTAPVVNGRLEGGPHASCRANRDVLLGDGRRC